MDPYSIAAIIAAVVGVYQGEVARQDQKDAEDVQVAQDQIRQRNEKVRQVREARVATAKAQQAANNVGIGGSSLDAGGSGSIQSQLAGNISNMNGEANASRGITGKLSDANKAMTRGSQAMAIGGMFKTFGNAGLFNGNTENNTTPTPKPVTQQYKYMNPPQQ